MKADVGRGEDGKRSEEENGSQEAKLIIVPLDVVKKDRLKVRHKGEVVGKE